MYVYLAQVHRSSAGAIILGSNYSLGNTVYEQVHILCTRSNFSYHVQVDSRVNCRQFVLGTITTCTMYLYEVHSTSYILVVHMYIVHSTVYLVRGMWYTVVLCTRHINTVYHYEVLVNSTAPAHAG